MLSKIIFVLCYIFSFIVSDEAARILGVFPTPSISHQVVFRPLMQELARRGHDVVVITTDPVFPKGKAPANLTEIDVHDSSYRLWREHFSKTTSGRKDDLYNQMKSAWEAFLFIFESQVQTDEVQTMIRNKNKHFDLIFAEACYRSALAFSHVFKAPVIQISSFGAIYGNYETIGAPKHPLLYPEVTRQKIYNLTLWEKVTELYNQYWLSDLYYEYEDLENKMLRKLFDPSIPSLSELKNNVDMLFLNTHPIWEGNRPVPPGVLYMWGIHRRPEKELPKDLKLFLDSSKNGVIYISFGTNVNLAHLSKEKIQILVKVFSQLPYDVLWKWDVEELPGLPKNIKTSKWLPQSDLLRHPNIKLFITQGGLQSTDESIKAGVPLIGVPILGDQWYNVEKYLYHKIGLRLDIETLTEDQFRNAVQTVIGDKSYRQNIARLRSVMHDQPQSPLERAVWWTEHVLRHGGARHLRAPAANMPWTQYLELELVTALLATLLTVMTAIIGLIYFVFRIISTRFRYTVKIKSS